MWGAHKNPHNQSPKPKRSRSEKAARSFSTTCRSFARALRSNIARDPEPPLREGSRNVSHIWEGGTEGWEEEG